MEEGREDPVLYDLIVYVLGALNTGVMEKEGTEPFVSDTLHEPYRALRLIWSACGTCSTPVDNIPQQRITFDFREGRLICDRCGANTIRHGITVSKGNP